MRRVCSPSFCTVDLLFVCLMQQQIKKTKKKAMVNIPGLVKCINELGSCITPCQIPRVSSQSDKNEASRLCDIHVGGVYGILSTLSWIIMKRICAEESLNLCLCNERSFKDNGSVALIVSVRRVLQSTMATRTRAHSHFNEEIFTLIECSWEPDINDSWITILGLYTLRLTL